MAVESIKGMKHPAVYPAKLIAEFLHLLTQEGDIVLDPFIGSGSTAVACKLLNRRYIGFELSPDYCQQAQTRLADVQPVLPLFFSSVLM
jgi:DNA modification methylase